MKMVLFLYNLYYSYPRHWFFRFGHNCELYSHLVHLLVNILNWNQEIMLGRSSRPKCESEIRQRADDDKNGDLLLLDSEASGEVETGVRRVWIFQAAGFSRVDSSQQRVLVIIHYD